MVHGRVEGILTAIRITLSFVFVLSSRFQSNALLAAVCVAVGALTYSFLAFMPFYKPILNRAHCAANFVLCWACACVVLLQIRNQPEVRLVPERAACCTTRRTMCATPRVAQSNVEAFLFLLGAPSVAYVGYGMANWAYNRSRFTRDITCPFGVRASGRRIEHSVVC